MTPATLPAAHVVSSADFHVDGRSAGPGAAASVARPLVIAVATDADGIATAGTGENGSGHSGTTNPSGTTT